MIKENAFVVKKSDGIAWIATQRKSTCSSCQVKSACGTATLEKVLGKKRTHLQVKNPNDYSVGDEVIIGLNENALVRGSLLLYLVPLLFLFGFVFVGEALAFLYGFDYNEGFKIVSAMIGLILGFMYVSYRQHNLVQQSAYQVEILGRADKPINFK